MDRGCMTTLNATPNLALQASLDLTNSNLTKLTAQVTALAAQLGVDEAALAKLVAAVPVVAPPVTAPGTVMNVAVVSTTSTSATLSFTEVTDGAGLPASYDLRFALGTLVWPTAIGTAYPGTSVGTKRTLTVVGLTPGSAYQFQVLAYRGTLDVNAVFGALSSVAQGTTAASTVVLPPPPPPSGGWPNEPTGMTLVTDEPFNALVEGGWRMVQRQTTNGSGLALIADPTAPHSPPGVLQFTYAQGFVAGSEPGVEFYDPPSPILETYFAFWWKPSNPFQNEGASNVNKIAFLLTQSADIYIMMQAVGSRYRIAVEPEFPGDTRVMAPNVTDTTVTLGQWHLIEWYVKCSSSPSTRDGLTKWWLDGVLQGSYTDLLTPGGFTEYQLAPTWGGLYSVKSETDYYWFDHARISRR